MLKKIHFLKDRFIFDDYESGLYFDICPVTRPAGDENVFNAAIETAAAGIHESEPSMQAWKPTLLLKESQMFALPQKYREQFSPKTYLMLYKDGFDGSTLPKNLWFDYGSGGLMCNPTGAHKDWKYYTNYTAEGLGHRFRRVRTDEVDAYKYTEPSSGGSTTPTEEPVDGGGSITIPTNIRIDLHVWHHNEDVE